MDLLVNKIAISEQEKQFFCDRGFLKLSKLLTTESIDQLREMTGKQTYSPPSDYSGELSKIGYDIDEDITRNIYSSANFQQIIQQLIPEGLTFIQGAVFELKANQKGFRWHHDLLSLCYVMPEDVACTLWIPLDAIDTNKQHGGLACVSHKIHSARGYFDLVYQLGQQDGLAEFAQSEACKQWDLSYASDVEQFLLDRNEIVEDFDLGDVLLMNKFVWHKSCQLKRGDLAARRVYVMRFVGNNARFSKRFTESTYTLLQSTTNDVRSDLGYQLTNILNEGDIISDRISDFHNH